ncbi:MAG: hypothetical protein HC905_02285 [Bacteroidales bacterium]|nr:hypothetical protein [Bacteroidales bacterium]
MKKILYIFSLIASAAIMFPGCDEDPYSLDYDITLPAINVNAVSNDKPFVGDTIRIDGENMMTIANISIDVYNFNIIEKQDNYIRIVVPRVIEGGAFSITNAYKRQFTTTQVLNPQFYPATVEAWPTEIQRGKPFILKGQNLDLLKEVKVNGKVASIMGAATATKVSYATAGIELGETAIIEVTPKTGDKKSSSELPVVAPKNTYLPQQTIMLWDFETAPGTTEGWGGSPFTATQVDGFFGKAYEVKSPAGNGWNGCYIRLTNNNGGQGYDLSAFNKPYITFLVNTKGKKGYANPAITIGGAESDKHFTGQGGQYSDNYMISTTDWEWRSYDLEKMGWSNIKSKIDKIDLWFRGGNVGAGDEFEIMVDQIMITDGPLNPTLVWDAEAKLGGSVTYVENGGTGLTGYSQGSKYATYKYTVAGSWDWVGAIASNNNVTLDPIVYSNGIYINYLVNTGNANGYAVLEYVQGTNKLADQLPNGGPYGDNYMFKPTNGNWEWRSLKFDPATLSVWGGAADKFDISKPFTVNINVRSGNISSGPFEVNLDYFIFTTVPLDPNLKQE